MSRRRGAPARQDAPRCDHHHLFLLAAAVFLACPAGGHAAQRVRFDEPGASWATAHAVTTAGSVVHNTRGGVRPGAAGGYVALDAGGYIHLGDADAWRLRPDITFMAWVRRRSPGTIFSIGSPRTSQRCVDWTAHTYGTLADHAGALLQEDHAGAGLDGCKDDCSAHASCASMEYSAVTSTCRLYSCKAGAAGCEVRIDTTPAEPLPIVSSCVTDNPGLAFYVDEWDLVLRWLDPRIPAGRETCRLANAWASGASAAPEWRLVSFSLSLNDGYARVEVHSGDRVETTCDFMTTTPKGAGLPWTAGHAAAAGVDLNGVHAAFSGDIDDLTLAAYGTTAVGVAATRQLAGDLSMLAAITFDEDEAVVFGSQGGPRNDVRIARGKGVRGSALAVNMEQDLPADAAYILHLGDLSTLGALSELTICAWVKPMCHGALATECGMPWSVKSAAGTDFSLRFRADRAAAFSLGLQVATTLPRHIGCFNYDVDTALPGATPPRGPFYQHPDYFVKRIVPPSHYGIRRCDVDCGEYRYFFAMYNSTENRDYCLCTDLNPVSLFAKVDDTLCGATGGHGLSSDPGKDRRGAAPYATVYEHMVRSYTMVAPGNGDEPFYCPPGEGAMPIATHQDCTAAAVALGLTATAQQTTYDNTRIPGCSWDTQTSTLYFGEGTDPFGAATDRLICKVPRSNPAWREKAWQWMCSVRDEYPSGRAQLYVDDDVAVESSSSLKLTFAEGDVLQIGGGGRTAATQFRGYVDGLRISRRAERPTLEGFQRWRLADLNRVYSTALLGPHHTGVVQSTTEASATTASPTSAFIAARPEIRDAHFSYRVRVQKADMLDMNVVLTPDEVRGPDAYAAGLTAGLVAEVAQQDDAMSTAEMRFVNLRNTNNMSYPGSCPRFNMEASTAQVGHEVEQVRFEDGVGWAAVGGSESWIKWTFHDGAVVVTGVRVTAMPSMQDLFVRGVLEYSVDAGATWQFVSSLVPNTSTTAQQRFGQWGAGYRATHWRVRMTPDVSGNLGVDYLALDLRGYSSACGGASLDCEYAFIDQAALVNDCPVGGRGSVLSTTVDSGASDSGVHICEAACNDHPACAGYAYSDEDSNCTLVTDSCAFGDSGDPIMDGNWSHWAKTSAQCGWTPVRYGNTADTAVDFALHYDSLSRTVQFTQTQHSNGGDAAPSGDPTMYASVYNLRCEDEGSYVVIDREMVINRIVGGFVRMAQCVDFCEASAECQLCVPSECSNNTMAREVCTYAALRQCGAWMDMSGVWVGGGASSNATTYSYAKAPSVPIPAGSRAHLAACDVACGEHCAWDPLTAPCGSSSNGGVRTLDVGRLLEDDGGPVSFGVIGTLTPWPGGGAAAAVPVSAGAPSTFPLSGGMQEGYANGWLGEMELAVFSTRPVDYIEVDFQSGYTEGQHGQVYSGNFELAGGAGPCGSDGAPDAPICLAQPAPGLTGFAHITSPFATAHDVGVYVRFGVARIPGSESYARVPYRYGVAFQHLGPVGAPQTSQGVVVEFDGTRFDAADEGSITVYTKDAFGNATAVGTHVLQGSGVSIMDEAYVDAWVTVGAEGWYTVAVATGIAEASAPTGLPTAAATFEGNYSTAGGKGALKATVGDHDRVFASAFGSSGCGEMTFAFRVGYFEGNTSGGASASRTTIAIMLQNLGNDSIELSLQPGAAGGGGVSVAIAGAGTTVSNADTGLPVALNELHTLRLTLRSSGEHSVSLSSGDSENVVGNWTQDFTTTAFYVRDSALKVKSIKLSVDSGYVGSPNATDPGRTDWVAGTEVEVNYMAQALYDRLVIADASNTGLTNTTNETEADLAMHTVTFEGGYCRAAAHTIAMFRANATAPPGAVGNSTDAAPAAAAAYFPGDAEATLSTAFPTWFPRDGFAVDFYVRKDVDARRAAFISYTLPGEDGSRFDLSDTGTNWTVRMGSQAGPTHTETIDVPDHFNPVGEALSPILHGFACANADQQNNTVPGGAAFHTAAACDAFCRGNMGCTACTPVDCALQAGACSCRYRAVRHCHGAVALQAGCTPHPTSRKPAGWVHAGFAWEASGGCWAFYRDGQRIYGDCGLHTAAHVPPGGRLYIGQRVPVAGSTEPTYALKGALAHVRFWSGVPAEACMVPFSHVAREGCGDGSGYSLAAAWPLLGGSFKDASGHGRHLEPPRQGHSTVTAAVADTPTPEHARTGPSLDSTSGSSVDAAAGAGADTTLPSVAAHPRFTKVNPNGGCVHAVSADVSGDGLLDVVCVTGDGEVSYIDAADWRSVSLGFEMKVCGDGTDAMKEGVVLEAGDIDADGDVDVYATCAGTVVMWLNNGAGKLFTARQTTLPPSVAKETANGLCIVDVEGDGAAEVVLTHVDPTLSPPRPPAEAPHPDWWRDDVAQKKFDKTSSQCVPWMRGDQLGSFERFSNGTVATETTIEELSWRVVFSTEDFTGNQSLFTYTRQRLTQQRIIDIRYRERLGPDDEFGLRLEQGSLVCHSPAGFIHYQQPDAGAVGNGGWVPGATYTATCVWNGAIAGMHMYVDGRLVGYVQGEGTRNDFHIIGTEARATEKQVVYGNDKEFLIGCSEGWERWDDLFAGRIESVAVYDGLLTPGGMLPTAGNEGTLEVLLALDFDDATDVMRDDSYYKWNVSGYYASRDMDGVRGAAVRLSPMGAVGISSVPIRRIIPNPAEVTIALWVRVSAEDASNEGFLLGIGDADEPYASPFGVRYYHNGKIGCGYPGHDGTTDIAPVLVVSEASVAVGEWTHVICTFSGHRGELNVFINHVNEGSVQHGARRVDLPNNYLRVGADWVGEGTSVDEVRVFAGAIPAARVVDAFGTSARLVYHVADELTFGTNRARALPATRLAASSAKTISFIARVDLGAGQPTWDATTPRCVLSFGSGTVADADKVKICLTKTSLRIGPDAVRTVANEFPLHMELGEAPTHIAVRQSAAEDRGLGLYTLSDTMIEVFVAGKQVAAGTVPGGFAPAWRYGDNLGVLGEGWLGTLQDVRFYTGVMSDDEIFDIATRGAFDIVEGVVWAGGHPEFATDARLAVPHAARVSGRIVGCEDFDADGDVDVALASQSGLAPTVTIFENLGSGVFSPFQLNPSTFDSTRGWKPRPNGDDEITVHLGTLEVNDDETRELFEAHSNGGLQFHGSTLHWYAPGVRERLCEAVRSPAHPLLPCTLIAALPASRDTHTDVVPLFYVVLATDDREYVVKARVHGFGDTLEVNPMQVVSFAVDPDDVAVLAVDAADRVHARAVSGGGFVLITDAGVFRYDDADFDAGVLGRAPMRAGRADPSSTAATTMKTSQTLADYPFNEGEGSFVMDQRFGAAGRLTGSASWMPPANHGSGNEDTAYPTPFPNALAMHGAGRVVMRVRAGGDAAAKRVDAATAMLWVRAKCDLEREAALMSIGDSWHVMLHNQAVMVQAVAPGAAAKPRRCGALVSPLGCDGDWHHVAVTWTGGMGYAVYVDGRNTATCSEDYFRPERPGDAAVVDFEAGQDVVIGDGFHGDLAGFKLTKGAMDATAIRNAAAAVNHGPVPGFYPSGRGVECPLSGGWVPLPDDIAAKQGVGPTCVRAHLREMEHREALGFCARSGRCDYAALTGAFALPAGETEVLTVYHAATTLADCQDVCCEYPGCEGVKHTSSDRACTLLKGFKGFTGSALAGDAVYWQVVKANPAHYFRMDPDGDGLVRDEVTDNPFSPAPLFEAGRHGRSVALDANGYLSATLVPNRVSANVWSIGFWTQQLAAPPAGESRCHITLGGRYEICQDDGAARVVVSTNADVITIYTGVVADAAWHYHEVAYNGYSVHYSRDCAGAGGEQLIVANVRLTGTPAVEMIGTVVVGAAVTPQLLTSAGSFRYDDVKIYAHFAPTCGSAGAKARVASKRHAGTFVQLRSERETDWLKTLLDPEDRVWLGVTSGNEAYTDYPGRVSCYKSPDVIHPVFAGGGSWECGRAHSTARAVCEAPGRAPVAHAAPILFTTLPETMFPNHAAAAAAAAATAEDPYWTTLLRQRVVASADGVLAGSFPSGRYHTHGTSASDGLYAKFDVDWGAYRDARGLLELRLSYPAGDCHGHALKDIVWRQESTPDRDGAVLGYVPVDVPYTALRGQVFHGLAGNDGKAPTLLATATDAAGAVFGVGARELVGCGAPGPQGTPVPEVVLSVRNPTPAPEPAPSAVTVAMYIKAGVELAAGEWGNTADAECPGVFCGCDTAVATSKFVDRRLAQDFLASTGARKVTVSAKGRAEPGTAWACGSGDPVSRGGTKTKVSNMHTLHVPTRKYGVFSYQREGSPTADVGMVCEGTGAMHRRCGIAIGGATSTTHDAVPYLQYPHLLPNLWGNNEWQHLMITWESTRGCYEVFHNGESVAKGCGHNVGGTVAPGGVLSFGHHVTKVSTDPHAPPTYSEAEALHGGVAQFTMWDRQLAPEEIRSFYYTKAVHYDADPTTRTPPVVSFPLTAPQMREGRNGTAHPVHLLQAGGVFEMSHTEPPLPPAPEAPHRSPTGGADLLVRRFTGEDVAASIGVSDAMFGFASKGATVCAWHRSLDSERTLFAYARKPEVNGTSEAWVADFGLACGRGRCWVELSGAGRQESPSFPDTLLDGDWRHVCVAVTPMDVVVYIDGGAVAVSRGRARVVGVTALQGTSLDAAMAIDDAASVQYVPGISSTPAALCYGSGSAADDALTLRLSQPFVVASVVVTALDSASMDMVAVRVGFGDGGDSVCQEHVQLRGHGPHRVVCERPVTGDHVTIANAGEMSVCDVAVEVHRAAGAWAEKGWFRLGAHPRVAYEPALLFAGALADVRVWGAARSAKELARDHAVASARRTLGLWAEWSMANDEDTSGGGNHLTKLVGFGMQGVQGRWVKVLQHRLPAAWPYSAPLEQPGAPGDDQAAVAAELGRLAEEFRLADGWFALQLVYPQRREGGDRTVWYQESDPTTTVAEEVTGFAHAVVSDNNAVLADFAGLGYGGGALLAGASATGDYAAMQYVVGTRAATPRVPGRKDTKGDGFSVEEVQVYAFQPGDRVCGTTWSARDATECTAHYLEYPAGTKAVCERRCRGTRGCVGHSYPHACTRSAAAACCRVHTPGVEAAVTLTSPVYATDASQAIFTVPYTHTVDVLVVDAEPFPGAAVLDLPQELATARVVAQSAAPTPAQGVTVTPVAASWFYVIYDPLSDGGLDALLAADAQYALYAAARPVSVRDGTTGATTALRVRRRLLRAAEPVTVTPTGTGRFTFAIKPIAVEDSESCAARTDVGSITASTYYSLKRTCRGPHDALPAYEPVGEALREHAVQCHAGDTTKCTACLPGSGVLPLTAGPRDASACAALCQKTRGCYYFTFYDDDAHCSLLQRCDLPFFAADSSAAFDGATYKMTLPASSSPARQPFAVPPPRARPEVPPAVAPSYRSIPGQTTYYPQAAIPAAAHPVSALTIEFWFKAYDAACTACRQVPLSLTAAGVADCFALEIGGDGVATLVFAGQVHADPLPEVTVVDGKWHHLAFAYDAATGNGVFRFDGVEQTPLNLGAVALPIRSVLRVGQYFPEGIPAPSKAFNGEVIHVRLWGAARTGHDIDTCRYSRVGSYQQTLVGAWSLEDDLRDASGRGLHLAMQTSTTWDTVTNTIWTPYADDASMAVAANQAECSALCAAEPGCTAWTWTTAGSCLMTTRDALSWVAGTGVTGRFKSCTGALWSAADGVLFGPFATTPFPTVPVDPDVAGYWYDARVGTADACAAACQSRDACEGWTWVAASTACYGFKNASATMQAAVAGYTSSLSTTCTAYDSVALVPVEGNVVASASHLRAVCLAAGARPLDITTERELGWVDIHLRVYMRELATTAGTTSMIPIAQYYGAVGAGYGLGHPGSVDARRMDDLFVGLPGSHGAVWAEGTGLTVNPAGDGEPPALYLGLDLAGAQHTLASWLGTEPISHVACASTRTARWSYHEVNVVDPSHPACVGTEPICTCPNGVCTTPFGPCECHAGYYPPQNCTLFCPHKLVGGVTCVVDGVPEVAKATDEEITVTPAPLPAMTAYDVTTGRNTAPVWQTTAIHLVDIHSDFEVKVVLAGGRACTAPPFKANSGGGFALVGPAAAADACARVVDKRNAGAATLSYLYHAPSGMCYKSDTVASAPSSEYLGCALQTGVTDDDRCASRAHSGFVVEQVPADHTVRRGAAEAVVHATLTEAGEYLVCYKSSELDGGAWRSAGTVAAREWSCEEKRGLAPDTQCGAD